jgi:hypothetical protein
MRSTALTIKRFAHDYFVRVNYVDIYGRKVGYDYEHILTELKKKFPTAKTSKRWLRMMAYELNGTTRMPVRRRSRRALAEGYAMTLLLSTPALNFNSIRCRVYRKFPDTTPSLADLKRLEGHLRFLKFTVPARPRDK